jgi:dipeptidyl aminopeptidase/acylaminoacyl peptidase
MQAFKRCAFVVVVALGGAGSVYAEPRAFSVQDLVSMDRVSDPRIAPDGRHAVYTLRETDLPNNEGLYNVWLLNLSDTDAQPRKLSTSGGRDARWSADGSSLFFLSRRSGSSQVWRLDLAGGEAQQVTDLPVDVNTFAVAPDGKHLALSMDVFADCNALACTKQRLDDTAAKKNTGVLYDKLFVRHWDTWANRARAQLFIAELDAHAKVGGEPRLVSKGVDGDVPSKPFGDSSEISFAPDGRSLVFAARIAGTSEPMSTNFDLYRVPVDGGSAPQNLTADNLAWDTGPVFSPDGATLYFKAMKRPGFEADRFGIMVKNLATGATRELAPTWDRSAENMALSPDGKTLYVSAQDIGQLALFAIDIGNGKVTRLVGQGTVSGFDVKRDTLVYALNTLRSPDQLYRLPLRGGAARQLTQHNAERLDAIRFGDAEQFSFKGWNGETV